MHQCNHIHKRLNISNFMKKSIQPTRGKQKQECNPNVTINCINTICRFDCYSEVLEKACSEKDLDMQSTSFSSEESEPQLSWNKFTSTFVFPSTLEYMFLCIWESLLKPSCAHPIKLVDNQELAKCQYQNCKWETVHQQTKRG